MAHSYFIVADAEEGIETAHAFAESLGMSTVGNPDLMTLRHAMFSVEDARRLQSLAGLAPVGEQKVLVVSVSRIFHEAQNALLKLFEEPPAGTILILVIPTEGLLLSTLRSRLAELPQKKKKTHEPSEPAHAFLSASKTEREKIIAKLLDRAKSDKDEEKQAARNDAVQLVAALTIAAHDEWRSESNASKKHELQLFLEDLSTFQPILHERSAPLKLIFEHILLTLPKLAA